MTTDGARAKKRSDSSTSTGSITGLHIRSKLSSAVLGLFKGKAKNDSDDDEYALANGGDVVETA